MSPDPQPQATYTPALLGLVWSAMFGFSAFFFSYSTMVTIAATDGLSTVTGGSVLTTMMIGVIVAQPFAPWAGRVFGFKASLLMALVLQFLGQLLGLFVSPPLLALVLAGLCGGVGFGLFVVLANAAVPGTTAPGRIGKALGFFGGITSLASAVGAPLGLWLVETIPIWIFRIIVCACLLLAIPTVLKYVPGRSPRRGKDDAGDSARGNETVGVRPGHNEKRSLRKVGRRAGEVFGLILMLSPFLIGMIVFGIIIGFGPGEDVAVAALFIAGMQVSAVIGRFVVGAIADHLPPFALNILGLVLTAIGLVCAVVSYDATLFVAMLIIGLGLGAMQSASLVMAFASVSSPSRASVAWNMNFDIGLAIAGVVGGLGFTYLGSSSTFLVCALVLLFAGALSWIARTLQTRNN
ncbi:Predicted arabinose efflux permease, MFS family [Brevibacterium iodinum ATCC 49514]|uniref:Predicted arabinose efflux permease, MFS family n=1 Tax=Brevibacterium iodinum ATCC 49514 TaxID=1255616 RepID=A0A2H1HSH1_9MICO|nr:MFS transporter [Brevibacterium iodinum]SMX65883.1 Predicted arabinose efflux permease, MFS family [Brevibacterium iodinum ATCC 49514]SUW13495.1 Arabinose efflux permease [Brevibacterium iodinum]